MSIFTNPASASREHAHAYIAAVLDALDDKDPMRVLAETPDAFRKSIEGLSPDQLGASEAPRKWSMRHVLAHMTDSEIVWSFRLRMILAQDRPSLAGYDQDLWTERLGYEEIEVGQSLHAFAALRERNVDLLRRASTDDLKRVGLHEERGEESVEHLVRLYAGHDIVHVRQVARIRRVVTNR